jgi:hypothetical protein
MGRRPLQAACAVVTLRSCSAGGHPDWAGASPDVANPCARLSRPYRCRLGLRALVCHFRTAVRLRGQSPISPTLTRLSAMLKYVDVHCSKIPLQSRGMDYMQVFKEIFRMKKYVKVVAEVKNFFDIIKRRNHLKKPQSKYDPNKLFNTLIMHLALSNDGALAKKLGISSLVISKIRQFTQPVTGTLLILIHEKTGLSFSELREFMGDRRQKLRIQGAQLLSQT